MGELISTSKTTSQTSQTEDRVISPKKVLIVPHAGFFAGLMSDIRFPNIAKLASLTFSESEFTPTSRLMYARTAALQKFAIAILGQSTIAVSKFKKQTGGASLGDHFGAGHCPPHCTMLPGLGALIAEADSIDRVALQAAGLCAIFDNVLLRQLPAKAVVTSPPAGLTSPVWHRESTQVTAARAKGLDGEDVLIGMLDTGIDASHPEFDGKTIYYEEFDEHGNSIGTTPRDSGQHGTQAAGLMAGRTLGVAPQAELAVAGVLTTSLPSGPAGYLVQIAAGMNWLLTQSFSPDPGVDVLFAALESGMDAGGLYAMLTNTRLSPGTGLIAPIGSPKDPGNFDITFGTGAVNQQDQMANQTTGQAARYQGTACKPDIWAPGVDLVSCRPASGYATLSGAAGAAALVTGAAALLIQQNPTLGFNVPALFSRLGALARPIPGSQPGLCRPGILDFSRI